MKSKLGKVLGLEIEGLGSSPEMEDESKGDDEPEDKDSQRSVEILAMKKFKRAATTEDMVEAMKGFLEACGIYASDDED